MRYTEARPEAIAEAMMADLDKETVDFVPNYDETTEEPTVLPDDVPEPAGQRLVRHRRRHGDQHPAAQPARGDRRRDRVDRSCAAQPKDVRLPRAAEGDPGPGLSRPAASSSAARASSTPTRPAAASITMRARADDRGEQEGRPASSIVVTEIPVPGEQGAADREDRRAGAREDRSRASPICATSPTATACASSSSCGAAKCPRSC